MAVAWIATAFSNSKNWHVTSFDIYFQLQNCPVSSAGRALH